MMAGGGHTHFTTAASPTLGLAPLIAGPLSAGGIDPTLLMIPGIPHQMTDTVG